MCANIEVEEKADKEISPLVYLSLLSLVISSHSAADLIKFFVYDKKLNWHSVVLKIFDDFGHYKYSQYLYKNFFK